MRSAPKRSRVRRPLSVGCPCTALGTDSAHQSSDHARLVPSWGDSASKAATYSRPHSMMCPEILTHPLRSASKEVSTVPDMDHRQMTPPHLRIVKATAIPAGGEVYVWDLRIAQPNVSHCSTDAIHSLEHLLNVYMSRSSQEIIGVAPMGCQTGMYIFSTHGVSSKMAQTLSASLEEILTAPSVPLADTEQCGWAENHSLVGAQRIARWLLDRQQSWSASAS